MGGIKFRGISVKSGKWVYGDFVKGSFGQGIVNSIDITSDYVKYFGGSISVHIVKHETVGQFIGMKDSSGKEIYSGDKVISMDDENEVERVVEGVGEIDVSDISDDYGVTLLKWHVENTMCGVTVTGNIHEQEAVIGGK